MLKNREINGTEEIGLVTPTPVELVYWKKKCGTEWLMKCQCGGSLCLGKLGWSDDVDV